MKEFAGPDMRERKHERAEDHERRHQRANVIVKVSARERLFIEHSATGRHCHGYRPCTPSTR